MPIEDVDYLIDNSDTNSYIVRADSSMRDKGAFPTPSMFALNFTQPFSYVYGVDVLDASMPSSMWNIEPINNSFKYHQVWLNRASDYIGRESLTKEMFFRYHFQDTSFFPELTSCFDRKDNNRILFADEESSAYFDQVLSSSPRDNMIAMRRIKGCVPLRTVNVLNDDGRYFYLQFRDRVLALFSHLTDVMDVIKSIPGIRTLNISPAQTTYTYYGRSETVLPVVHEVNDTINVYILEHINLYDDLQTSLPFTKCAQVNAEKENTYYVFDDILYIQDSTYSQNYSDATQDVIKVLAQDNSQKHMFDEANVIHVNTDTHIYRLQIDDGVVVDFPLAYDASKNYENVIFYYNKSLSVSNRTYFDAELKSLVHYDFKYFNNTEYVNIIEKKVLPSVGFNWCSAIMFNGFVEIEPSNYNIFDYMIALEQGISESVQVTNTNGARYSYPFEQPFLINVTKANANGPVTRTGKIKFIIKSVRNTFFMIDIDNTTMAENIGFSVFKSVNTSSTDILFERILHPSRKNLLASVTRDDDEQIIPPGVVYLLGVRYVVLRCPEIESLIGSQSYDVSSGGIGIFKLALNQETVQQRLDFVHFVRKPFHPIEKMDRLTFRFELKDGQLYDFKGVDMFMILQINTYVPKRKHNFDPKMSMLNPNYDPDFMRYINRESDKKARQEKMNGSRPTQNNLLAWNASSEEEEYTDGDDDTQSEDTDILKIQNNFTTPHVEDAGYIDRDYIDHLNGFRLRS